MPASFSRGNWSAMSACAVRTCSSALSSTSSSVSPRIVSPHTQLIIFAISYLLGAFVALSHDIKHRSRRAGETVERLARRCLLGVFLRAAGADARFLPVDHGGAGERAVMRRPRYVEDAVGDLPALPGELLLQLGLVIDVGRQRIGDAPVERCDHRIPDRLETVLEVERGERRLEQRSEHV